MNKKLAVLSVAASIIIGGGAYWYWETAPHPTDTPSQSYTNKNFGVSFMYPSGFALSDVAYETSSNIVLTKGDTIITYFLGMEGKEGPCFGVDKTVMQRDFAIGDQKVQEYVGEYSTANRGADPSSSELRRCAYILVGDALHSDTRYDSIWSDYAATNTEALPALESIAKSVQYKS